MGAPMSIATKPLRKLPPLENGDRLTRDEFERRYHAMPKLKKAELIEGIVHMPSPVSFGYHGKKDVDFAWLLRHYTIFTPGVEAGSNSTVRLDLDNEPQPDHVLLVLPEFGGRIKIDVDGYVNGSPELVVEIAGSSASYDLGEKLKIYRRNMVLEYVVWRVYDEAIDWFAYRDGNFERKAPDEDGCYRSTIFPGLWVDELAVLNREFRTVLDALTRGLASPEHAAFVAKFAAAKKPA